MTLAFLREVRTKLVETDFVDPSGEITRLPIQSVNHVFL